MKNQFMLGGIAALTFFGGGAQAQGNGDSSVTQRPNGSIEARLSVDRTQYPANRAVAITMSVTNIGRQSQTVVVGRNRPYDYSIRDSRTNRVVYQMSRHRPITNGDNFTLQPGDGRTYRELWDQRDDAGKPVAGGVYVIEARIWPQTAVSTQFYLAGQGGGQPRPDPQPGPGDPGNPGNPGRPGNPPGTPNNGLRGLLAANATRVQPGQTVQFTYTVDNQTNQPVQFAFSSGRQFDMAVSNPQGRVVWTASQGMGYTQALTQFELRPTERKTFQQNWAVPANLAPGTYRVTAYLTPQGNRAGVGTAWATLVVGGTTGGIRRGDARGDAEERGGTARVVALRDLVNDGAGVVGRRVTVSGTYMGWQGGVGAPPVRRSDWVLASEGVSVYVCGPDQGVRRGESLTVTATVRRTGDGRLYLDMQ